MKASCAAKTLVFFFACALLTGCSSGSAKHELFRPAMVGPNQAVIYVFRPSDRSWRSPTATVFINQSEVGELRSGQHLAKVVEPGEFLVRVEAKSSMVRSVVLDSGDVAYLMVETKRRGKAVIERPEPDLARRLITGTEKVEPLPEEAEEPH